MAEQLIKKDYKSGEIRDVFPIVRLNDVVSDDGTNLDSIIQSCNHIFIQFDTSRRKTRLQIPEKYRRRGLLITYITCKNDIVTESYIGNDITDFDWGDGNNWLPIRVDEEFIRGLIDELSKESLGLGRVDNTSDLEKPISTLTQEALDALKRDYIRQLGDHIDNMDNPHAVNKEQVGLGKVDNTSDENKPLSYAMRNALNSKVNVVAGKELSTNDYTNEDKEKLANLFTCRGINIGSSYLDLDNLKYGDYVWNKQGSVWKFIYYNGDFWSEWATDADITAIENDLRNKVDKVTGKGLSTNDFTNALKTKLDSLSQFDDSELRNRLSTLESNFSTLLESNPTQAIESFNEIVNFLAGVDDTETLQGLFAGVGQQVASLGRDIVDINSKIDEIESGEIEFPVTSVNGKTGGAITLVKADIGLGQVNNTSDLNKPISTATQTALNDKVDKVEGKELSSNDFTNAHKEKLESLPDDASQFWGIVNYM